MLVCMYSHCPPDFNPSLLTLIRAHYCFTTHGWCSSLITSWLPQLSLISGDVSDPKDTITTIHFTLVKKGVRRAAVQDNWTTIAVKVTQLYC